MLEKIEDLERWHKENSMLDNPIWVKEDIIKTILLSEIPQNQYNKVLDIGCGQGTVTRLLPGKKVIGTDISSYAVEKARLLKDNRLDFMKNSLFDLNNLFEKEFDLIFISELLYPRYTGNSYNLIYSIIDNLLLESGVLVTFHNNELYRARFPYVLINKSYHDIQGSVYRLEVYIK